MNRRNIGTVLVLVLVLAVAGFLAWKQFYGDDDSKRLATMHMAVQGSDDKQYCADLVADEIDKNQIEITITNCGDHAIKIKHGKTKKKLEADKEYSIKLRPGADKFGASVTTTKGESLGGFAL